MAKELASIMYELRDDGSIKMDIKYFNILKETQKMIYLETKGRAHEDLKPIRFLSQIRKADLGFIYEQNHVYSLSFQMCCIAEQEQIDSCVVKIMSLINRELDSRADIARKWRESYSRLIVQ